jgi:hypothetical protein
MTGFVLRSARQTLILAAAIGPVWRFVVQTSFTDARPVEMAQAPLCDCGVIDGPRTRRCPSSDPHLQVEPHFQRLVYAPLRR